MQDDTKDKNVKNPNSTEHSDPQPGHGNDGNNENAHPQKPPHEHKPQVSHSYCRRNG